MWAWPPPDLPQPFIQRAGPEILVRDLPPKLELVLQLAPTPTQLPLLQRLVEIVQHHDRNMLRDTEVGFCVCPCDKK